MLNPHPPHPGAISTLGSPGQAGSELLQGLGGPVSLVRKLICPRTSWDAPSWKPLGSLAVIRMFLLLPIPVARWTWRQGTSRGNLWVTGVSGMSWAKP